MPFSENVAVVDTYLSYLRRKLEIAGFNRLVTVRGVGVKLETE